MIYFASGRQICRRRRHDIWVCLILTTLILAVYSQVIHYDFVSLGDTVYVTANQHVKSGINPEGFLWSFHTTDCGNWHPLTWLSHMADVESYDLDAGGHHLTNVLFHIVNTLLLFFVLGLMAKPMLVTLPFVLMLLDYWPLGRIKFRSTLRLESSDPQFSVLSLLYEKIPFFLFTAASFVATYYAQQSGGAVRTFDILPLGLRISNAVVSYVAYMGKMFWPAQLAIFYPYSDSYAVWKIVAAAVLLIGLFIVIAWRADDFFGRWRVNRIFAMAAAAILILVLSAVSHIQVGHRANNITLFSHAVKVTRNNYLVHLSLGKALHDAGREEQAQQHYADALQINPNSTHAHVNIGSGLLAQGKIGRAMDHFNKALHLNPDFAEAHNNLGLALVRIGEIENSIHHFRRASGNWT